MKTQLTREESNVLINKGISENKASVRGIENRSIEYPIFTISDLLGLLPDRIGAVSILNIYRELDGKWYAHYTGHPIFHSPELINTLYQLILWLIDNNYPIKI